MVRAATPEDAAAIARIHVKSWQQAYAGILDRDFLGGLDLGTRTEWWESLLERGEGTTLVAESNGQVSGFSLVGASDDEGRGEIMAIYVDPEEWGAGHGHALLAASEDLLLGLGFDRAGLWVLEANQRARAFYERQGWSMSPTPFRLETIGGTEVTEVRYEKSLERP
jgi:ribosomal protein S18 acetylase RimI-like enzyme